MGTRQEDFVQYFLVASTHAYLLVFTNKGRVYWLKIYEIPDASTIGKGKNISNLINLQPDETVKAFMAVKDFVPELCRYHALFGHHPDETVRHEIFHGP